MPSFELKSIISVCLSSGMSTELIVEKLMAAGYGRGAHASPQRAPCPTPGETPCRLEALREYREHGGVVSVTREGKLAYPTREKLSAMIIDTEKRIMRISFNLRGMGPSAEPSDPADPLWIEHVFRKDSDGDYRADAEAVAPPASLLRDEQGRKVFDAFLHNSEYRSSLVAAAGTGITRLFRRQTDRSFESFVRNRQEKLLSEKKRLTALLRTLLVLRQWATEAAGKAS